MFSTDDITLLRQEFGNRFRLCNQYHLKVDKHNLWCDRFRRYKYQLDGMACSDSCKFSTFIRKVKEYKYVDSDKGQLEAAMALISSFDSSPVTTHTAFTDASIKNGRTRIAAVLLFCDGQINIVSRIIPETDINEAEHRAIRLAIQMFDEYGMSGSDFVIYNDNKTAVKKCNVDNVLWKSRTQTKTAHKAAGV